VEFALAAPLLFLVLIGIIVLGIMVFYNQQLTNAAREAARFASIGSATAICPVVGWLDPESKPLSYARCDRVEDGWPRMTAHARSKVFGLDGSAVRFGACWSGYVLDGNYDAPPPGNYPALGGPINSSFVPCTISGVDPTDDPEAIACAAGLSGGDTASSLSDATGRPVANRVTVFACYEWSPPAAGFLLIPETITFRAVITEPIQRQQ
jgi:hypothetical protein